MYSGHCTVHELITLTTVNYVTTFEFPERRRHAWFTRVGNVVNTYGLTQCHVTFRFALRGALCGPVPVFCVVMRPLIVHLQWPYKPHIKPTQRHLCAIYIQHKFARYMGLADMYLQISLSRLTVRLMTSK